MTKALSNFETDRGHVKDALHVPVRVAKHVSQRVGEHVKNALVVTARPNQAARLIDWATHPVTEVDTTHDELLRGMSCSTLARTALGRAWAGAFHCTEYGQQVSFGGPVKTAFAGTQAPSQELPLPDQQ